MRNSPGQGEPASPKPLERRGVQKERPPPLASFCVALIAHMSGGRTQQYGPFPANAGRTASAGVALRLLERSRLFFGGYLMDDGYPYNRDRYGRDDRGRPERA